MSFTYIWHPGYSEVPHAVQAFDKLQMALTEACIRITDQRLGLTASPTLMRVVLRTSSHDRRVRTETCPEAFPQSRLWETFMNGAHLHRQYQYANHSLCSSEPLSVTTFTIKPPSLCIDSKIDVDGELRIPPKLNKSSLSAVIILNLLEFNLTKQKILDASNQHL